MATSTNITKAVTIPAASVKTFEESFAAGDLMTLNRVKAVADVLKANNVGEKGAASQNAVLRALEEAIERKLGNSAVHRTGWKFANLGNYARVVKAVNELALSIESAKLIVTLYSVQNLARDSFGDFVKAGVAIPGTAKQREAAIVKAAEAIFSDRHKANNEAKAAKKAADEAKAAAKAAGQTGEAEGDDVTTAKQTVAAWLKSIEESAEGQDWTTKDYEKAAKGLRELADRLFSVESVELGEVVAETV